MSPVNKCWPSDSERFLKQKQQNVILIDLYILNASYSHRRLIVIANGTKVHGRNFRNAKMYDSKTIRS